jgi:hypothetical protein
MSDEELEYHYSDDDGDGEGDYAYGSDEGEDGEEGGGNDVLIEIENAYYEGDDCMQVHIYTGIGNLSVYHTLCKR